MERQNYGVGAYVPGRFALPQNPLWDGMGDYVPARFSIPQNPVGSRLSLPMAPALTQADINGKGCGCGGYGSCESCGGMGAFDMSSIQHLIPGTTFGISNTYLVAGGLLAFFLFSQKRGRR